MTPRKNSDHLTIEEKESLLSDIAGGVLLKSLMAKYNLGPRTIQRHARQQGLHISHAPYRALASHPIWTPAMDDFLTRNFDKLPMRTLADSLLARFKTIRSRAFQLGLIRRQSPAWKYEPTAEQWIAAASHRAREAELKPSAVIGPTLHRAASLARWRAWNDLRQANPSLSMAGIGRVSGFHHTSVRYGLLRLAGAPVGQ